MYYVEESFVDDSFGARRVPITRYALWPREAAEFNARPKIQQRYAPYAIGCDGLIYVGDDKLIGVSGRKVFRGVPVDSDLAACIAEEIYRLGSDVVALARIARKQQAGAKTRSV
ncbi:hypothetical protein [Polyangium mundeleinium]|uniref:Uncharacterized protein n=1 Tax=Polyangium mundeleinium TaxID=2995306 RepID=A0ABT5F357_9BACT|nr:hypothetical protein [Polyangium mundeleinium]MDC0747843.1 hypothetical protein [Polyangium mundeleinium]